MRESRALRRGMAKKRTNPRVTASRRWQGSSWRGTDGIRMDDRTPRRSSRARLMRVSVTEVGHLLGNYPETDSRTFHIVDCTGPTLPPIQTGAEQRSVITLQSSFPISE